MFWPLSQVLNMDEKLHTSAGFELSPFFLQGELDRLDHYTHRGRFMTPVKELTLKIRESFVDFITLVVCKYSVLISCLILHFLTQ